jgi:hypothetical protein
MHPKAGDIRGEYLWCYLPTGTVIYSAQFKDYVAATNNNPQATATGDTPTDISDRPPSRGKPRALGPTFSTQGAILLQSMLRVHEPHNQSVLGRRVLYHYTRFASKKSQTFLAF